jgi:uncharacterized membrane protein YphA (DoxX/SURF4 family)
MKIATIIARILLGLMFVVFGLNGFLHFIPTPSQPKSVVTDFTGAMASTGYLHVVMAIQLIGGALVLTGRFLPLGLLLLGPVIVNILLFHLFMDRTGLLMALVVSALSLFLLARYWSAFRAIFRSYPPAT